MKAFDSIANSLLPDSSSLTDRLHFPEAIASKFLITENIAFFIPNTMKAVESSIVRIRVNASAAVFETSEDFSFMVMSAEFDIFFDWSFIKLFSFSIITVACLKKSFPSTLKLPVE